MRNSPPPGQIESVGDHLLAPETLHPLHFDRNKKSIVWGRRGFHAIFSSQSSNVTLTSAVGVLLFTGLFAAWWPEQWRPADTAKCSLERLRKPILQEFSELRRRLELWNRIQLLECGRE